MGHIKPPRFSARLLTWLLDDDWETPVGDFEEYFNQKAEELGEQGARRWYRRQVLSMFPSRLFEKFFWNMIMLGSNMKVAYRALKRNTWYSAVNIGGLAVGIAACVLIVLFIQDELTFDRMHNKADRIVRVVEAVESADGGEQHFVYTMGPLGPTMAAQIPEVESYVRMVSRWTIGRQTVQYGDNWFYEADYLDADSTFFDIFDFEAVSGDLDTALDAPAQVVLTESAARRYFGDVDPMGKILNLERDGDFTVMAVIKDPPPDTHLDFSMVMSLSTFESFPGWGPYMRNWESDQFITYMLLREGANVEQVQAKMDELIARNAGDEVTSTRRAYLQPMTEVHFGSAHVDFDENQGRSTRSIPVMLSLVGLFILTIACINYTNMTTAAAMQRAKEVGLRKTVGAHRSQLVKQFLSESLVTTLAAFILAIILAWLALGPFNTLTGKALSMNPAQNPFSALVLVLLVVVVGLLSGTYPALFLSRFTPAAVLKGGKSTSRSSQRIRQSLVVAQFALSIGLIIASLVVYRQLEFVQNTNLGFNAEQLVVVDINGGGPRSNFRSMKADISAVPAVRSVTVSSGVPGDWKNINQINLRGNNAASEELVASYFLGVDADFLEAFEIDLIEGRNFAENAIADSMTVLLTQTAARRLGVGVGDQVSIPGESLAGRYSETVFEPTVIGIVKDFNFHSLHEAIDPMVLGYHTNPVDIIDYFTIRLGGQNVSETIAALRVVGEQYDPEHPFEFNFLDERMKDFYVSEIRLARIFGIATALAILIACLGLFGLAAYSTAQRTKEIGVRKVLGASVGAIVLLLSKDMVKLVGIAFVIAAPLAWLVMGNWLDSFAYRTEPGFGILLAAGGASVLLALVTVGWQAVKAAVSNPVDSLRYE